MGAEIRRRRNKKTTEIAIKYVKHCVMEAGAVKPAKPRYKPRALAATIVHLNPEKSITKAVNKKEKDPELKKAA